MRVNAYCTRCGKHAHLNLQGTEKEILVHRDNYVCSACIEAEVARDCAEQMIADGERRYRDSVLGDET